MAISREELVARDDIIRSELKRKQEAKYKNTPRPPKNEGKTFQAGIESGETGKRLWDKLSNNWRMLVENCVEQSSAATYGTGWRLFMKMCEGLEIDPTLAKIPSWWKSSESEEVPYRVAVILSFIAYMMTAKNLICRTMGTYLSGVGHNLRISRIDMGFWDHNLIKIARQGVVVRARVLELSSKDVTLPFTMET